MARGVEVVVVQDLHVDAALVRVDQRLRDVGPVERVDRDPDVGALLGVPDRGDDLPLDVVLLDPVVPHGSLKNPPRRRLPRLVRLGGRLCGHGRSVPSAPPAATRRAPSRPPFPTTSLSQQPPSSLEPRTPTIDNISVRWPPGKGVVSGRPDLCSPIGRVRVVRQGTLKCMTATLELSIPAQHGLHAGPGGPAGSRARRDPSGRPRQPR